MRVRRCLRYPVGGQPCDIRVSGTRLRGGFGACCIRLFNARRLSNTPRLRRRLRGRRDTRARASRNEALARRDGVRRAVFERRLRRQDDLRGAIVTRVCGCARTPGGAGAPWRGGACLDRYPVQHGQALGWRRPGLGLAGVDVLGGACRWRFVGCGTVRLRARARMCRCRCLCALNRAWRLRRVGIRLGIGHHERHGELGGLLCLDLYTRLSARAGLLGRAALHGPGRRRFIGTRVIARFAADLVMARVRRLESLMPSGGLALVCVCRSAPALRLRRCLRHCIPGRRCRTRRLAHGCSEGCRIHRCRRHGQSRSSSPAIVIEPSLSRRRAIRRISR